MVEGADALAYAERAGLRRTLRNRDGLWLTDADTSPPCSTGELLRLLAASRAAPSPSGGCRRTPAALDAGAGRRRAGAAAHLAVDLQRGSDPVQWLASAGAGGSSQIICLAGDTVERVWRLLAAADRAEPGLLPVDPARSMG